MTAVYMGLMNRSVDCLFFADTFVLWWSTAGQLWCSYRYSYSAVVWQYFLSATFNQWLLHSELVWL